MALVLARRSGEWLVFDVEGVRFRVTWKHSRSLDQVKLVVDTPPEVVVTREEMVDRTLT